MAVTIMKYEDADEVSLARCGEPTCTQLQRGDEPEALRFLAEHPIHTVFMATLIRDNGAVSPDNRGLFFAYRDGSQKIGGIALIGHATILEAGTDQAVAAFAKLAAHSQNAHLIRGERQKVRSFWKHYAKAGQEARLVCRELLFEKTKPTPSFEPLADLRPARLAELEEVVGINAQLAAEEQRIDPLTRDAAGFRARIARRINQSRVWICKRDGKTVFKADLVGDTPEMIYLEGVHVHPDYRGQGLGKKGLIQLTSILLRRSKAICLTINERKANLVAFYSKAGFDYHSEYETIYLR